MFIFREQQLVWSWLDSFPFTHVWVDNSILAPFTLPALLLLLTGRYEDDITAAKAYDKAAVYLYGANAITNFGLSQVVDDPTEVRLY
jgi:hypothetical protein